MFTASNPAALVNGSPNMPASVRVATHSGLPLDSARECMQVSVSGGDISPLVGHNAFLRWSAVKECAFTDPADGRMKYWSEAHVSEDFDLAMRFQVKLVHTCS